MGKWDWGLDNNPSLDSALGLVCGRDYRWCYSYQALWKQC